MTISALSTLKPCLHYLHASYASVLHKHHRGFGSATTARKSKRQQGWSSHFSLHVLHATALGCLLEIQGKPTPRSDL